MKKGKNPTFRSAKAIHNSQSEFVYDPRSLLLDRQKPKSWAKFAANPRSVLSFISANPFHLSQKSTIRLLFKANPRSIRELIHPRHNCKRTYIDKKIMRLYPMARYKSYIITYYKLLCIHFLAVFSITIT